MVNPVPTSASRLFSKPLHQRVASSVESPLDPTHPAPFLDVSDLDVRAGRNWLRLRLDDYGWGEPVPIRLGTTSPRAIPLRVACGTERIAVALGRNEPRLREIDVVTRPEEPAEVWVAPRDVGDPGRPTDRLIVTTPDGTLSIGAWVEPACGAWRGDPATSASTDEPSDAAGAGAVFRFPAARAKDELTLCVDAGRAWLYGRRRNGRRAPRLLASTAVPGTTSPSLMAVLPSAAHEPGGAVFHWDAGSGVHILTADGSASAGSLTCHRVEAPDGRRWTSATTLADGTLLLGDGEHRWRLFHPETGVFSTIGDTSFDVAQPILDDDGSVIGDRSRFFPPYLWRGPRPLVKHVPGAEELPCGGEFAIRAVGDSLDASARVCLVADGGDRALRWLPVGPIRQTAQCTTIRVGAPVRPGPYRLFVIDAGGVPSAGVRVIVRES